MIKKHLITCSVIFVLFIISKLFIYSVPDKKPLKNSGAILNFYAATKPASTKLNFAEEEMPLQNKKVNRKIRYSIWKHTVLNNQSPELQQQAEKWFPVIEPILKMYGIPEDFKYIPLLESGFSNKRRSPKGAAGFWQFMPQTARSYGLKVSRRRDERYNVRKSTIAACKYILELHNKFNSWTLTAAAYNAGSTRIMHAMNRKNKGNYFYMRLNRETSSYVYKLVAMKQVIKKVEEAKPIYAHYDAMWAMLKPTENLTLN